MNKGVLLNKKKNVQYLHLKNLLFASSWHRVFVQNYRFLNWKKVQLPKPRHYFQHRQLRWLAKNKNLHLWTEKQKNYINNFWLKYVNVSAVQSFFNFKKRYGRSYSFLCTVFKKDHFYNNPFTLKIPNKPWPLHEAFKKRWKMRKEFFSGKKNIRKAYPWLHTLIYKRKIYRLSRRRHFRRERNPWLEKKWYWYRNWLQLNKSRRNWARNVHAKKDLVFRRYIFLPYFKKYKSKSFKIVIKKLWKRHKFSQGNFMRGFFENRFDVVGERLNFAPTLWWSRSFSNSGFYAISNKNKPLVGFSNAITNWIDLDLSMFDHKKINSIKVKNKILLAKSINKELKNESYLKKNKSLNLFFSKFLKLNFHELINSNFQNQTSILKKNEICHVSPFFWKANSTYFMNTLKKKQIPNQFKLNSDKTAGLMIRDLQTVDLTKKHRISNDRWNAGTLHTRK